MFWAWSGPKNGRPTELPQSALIVPLHVNNYFWLAVRRRGSDYHPHEALDTCESGTRGMPADVIKLSDRRKAARPAPDAFELSMLFIAAYLAIGFLFFDAFVAASPKLTGGGSAQ
jgi:hypothetical protein